MLSLDVEIIVTLFFVVVVFFFFFFAFLVIYFLLFYSFAWIILIIRKSDFKVNIDQYFSRQAEGEAVETTTW